MIKRVMVAGGGTGGHLFPGLAVIEELRRRVSEVEVHFVGTPRGIESRILPARGEHLDLLSITPLKGQGFGARVRSFGRIPGAMREASALMRDFDPDVVLGVGGYASGPVLLAAALSGRPSAVLEQNAYVGMTNHILARFVDRAYISFEETAAVFGASKSVITGNPVRYEFVEHARLALADPEGFEARARNVLVLGGSQGARKLNEEVPHALERLGRLAVGTRIIHQTGTSMRDEVESRYRELGIEAEVVTFIDDMARAYSNASLVIARAGATTLAELCAIGRPAILIPFPFAADDHQAKNAEALERLGAAICVRESNLERDGLGRLIEDLLRDETRRSRMSEAARAHGKPDAAAAIVDDMLAWLGGGQGMGDPEPIPSHRLPGSPVRALGVAPAYGLAMSGTSMSPVPARPRRPVVVDGALWE